MAEVASGPMSLYMENLRILIANTARFQSLVGAVDAPAAMLSIDYPAVEGSKWLRPRVLIGSDGTWEHERIASPPQAPWAETTDLWFMLEIDIDPAFTAAGNEKLAHLAFLNTVGAIVTEMQELAGSAPYLDVQSMAADEGPMRSDEDDEARGEFWYGQMIRVRVRG